MLTWLWISLSVLFIIIALCAADYFLGKRNYQLHCRKRSYPKRQGDIHLINCGKDLFSSFFSDINQAKKSINILFYIVKNDQISKEFLKLLEKKALQGVKVRLLLDWLGSHNTSKDLIYRIKQAGVEVSFCHRPRLPFFFFTLQQRNHRKCAIIDGEIGYLGGYNVGKEYIDNDPVLSPWRDYHLRIKGESLQDLHEEFFVNWYRATGESSEKLQPGNINGTMKHCLFPTEGIRLEEQICQLIDSAQDTIYIGTPYFIPSAKVMKRLIAALNRGITIKIIVPKKSDHLLVKEASFRYFRTLLAQGAHVYQYLNGFYHAKVIIIDTTVCQIGTANFDRRSLFLNHELNCYIYDQDFIERMIKVVEKDILDSHKLYKEELARTSLLTKAKEMGARIIADIL
ncbi:cardiolipin synthase [Heyndrickxia oleronia]|uniref:cardiolipin synthase n=1 Tax=Heyndrickxia oleronia TaxID=38875 RepID=UPI0020409465|nr:cardiolipin synthase [Heyndrickxia oleronia]MCM3239843.1 cardiolipin synthase [Heyndrickxia oleronia]